MIMMSCYFCATFQGISGEAQLADDVTGDVRFDALAFLGVSLRRLQEVVELLGIELLGRQSGEVNAEAAFLGNIQVFQVKLFETISTLC